VNQDKKNVRARKNIKQILMQDQDEPAMPVTIPER